MRAAYVITATIFTLLGTVFCGVLMTLPNVYASEQSHCEPDSSSQHTAQHNDIPCHSQTSHDHHQLGAYSLQKDETNTSGDSSVAKVTFHPLVADVLQSKKSLPRYLVDMHERSRHKHRHIQTRKKE